MRIKLDRTMCEGFGKCADHLPMMVSFDEWGYAIVKRGAEVPSELQENARAAVMDCPLHAITVADA